MKSSARIRSILKYFVLIVVLSISLSLVWLRWESSRPREEWWAERHGRIETVATETTATAHGQQSVSVRLTSDSGLEVFFRVIRSEETDNPQPVLLILGGHRTGSDAVDLFGDVGDHAIVGVDYPYDGPEKVKGALPIAKAIPKARQAFLDTVPAVSLVLDWLVEQPWVDPDRVILIGASLGVPFAATAADRDQRVAGLILVHGAADNRLWLQAQVERRVDTEILHYPLATILHWLAYGPVLDTSEHVATLAPRPVLIIGAREDERTPAGQTELLFDAAGEPRRLRYTDGQHIEPDREEIIFELLRIADEEMPFLSSPAAPTNPSPEPRVPLARRAD
ncbi:MAG: prolyl oligopeptidase family serine peptidase [Gammaproteobacteria bacterium]|nr:prolyl oligopeptidase family serine peptidase [Gammaproteobacteria bacterium]